MKRCSKCILPESYPGISFNEDDVCSHCIDHEGIEYLGSETLKSEIGTFLKTRTGMSDTHDCVLGFSGGRDSSYLLYYLSEVLNLRVVAYSVDNGFIPEQTKANMKNMTDKLNVDLVIEKNDHLKKCIRHHVESWMKRPSSAMIGLLCTGCRVGMDLGTLGFAKRNRIPIIVRGGTPFEGEGYKFNIMRTDPNSKGVRSFILGYLSRVTKNPRWVLKGTSLITQLREFYHHYYRKTHGSSDQLMISPFWSHIRWKEGEVVSTIQNELGWKKNPVTQSTWRGDCDIALLKLYLYKKTLGFNDKDDGLSSLVRDGQIDREEAMRRLEEEGDIPEEVIRDIFEGLGLNYSDLDTALANF